MATKTPADYKMMKPAGYVPQKLGFDNRRPFNMGLRSQETAESPFKAKEEDVKEFKPHMMYKGKSSIMAKTMKKHLELKKKGYGHKKPK